MMTRTNLEDDVADEKFGKMLSARSDDKPISRISFGEQEFTEPSALTKCSDDTLINKSAEAPKPHLSPVEMYMLTSTAGDLLHTSSAYKT